MRTARSNGWSRRRNVNGDEIRYGRFDARTSNAGHSTRSASPSITSISGKVWRRYAANRRSASIATTRFARSTSCRVRTPSPGQISRTTSDGRRCAWSTWRAATRGSTRKCWPRLFRGRTPSWAKTRRGSSSTIGAPTRAALGLPPVLVSSGVEVRGLVCVRRVGGRRIDPHHARDDRQGRQVRSIDPALADLGAGEREGHPLHAVLEPGLPARGGEFRGTIRSPESPGQVEARGCEYLHLGSDHEGVVGPVSVHVRGHLLEGPHEANQLDRIIEVRRAICGRRATEHLWVVQGLRKRVDCGHRPRRPVPIHHAYRYV